MKTLYRAFGSGRASSKGETSRWVEKNVTVRQPAFFQHIPTIAGDRNPTILERTHRYCRSRGVRSCVFAVDDALLQGHVPMCLQDCAPANRESLGKAFRFRFPSRFQFHFSFALIFAFAFVFVAASTVTCEAQSEGVLSTTVRRRVSLSITTVQAVS